MYSVTDVTSIWSILSPRRCWGTEKGVEIYFGRRWRNLARLVGPALVDPELGYPLLVYAELGMPSAPKNDLCDYQ